MRVEVGDRARQSPLVFDFRQSRCEVPFRRDSITLVRRGRTFGLVLIGQSERYLGVRLNREQSECLVELKTAVTIAINFGPILVAPSAPLFSVNPVIKIVVLQDL